MSRLFWGGESALGSFTALMRVPLTPLPSERLSSHTGCFSPPVELCPKNTKTKQNKKQEKEQRVTCYLHARILRRSETFLPLRAGGRMDAPLGPRSSSRGIRPIIIQNPSEVWDFIGWSYLFAQIWINRDAGRVSLLSHPKSPHLTFSFINLLTAEMKAAHGEARAHLLYFFDPKQRASLLRQPRALTASQLGDPSARLTDGHRRASLCAPSRARHGETVQAGGAADGIHPKHDPQCCLHLWRQHHSLAP